MPESEGQCEVCKAVCTQKCSQCKSVYYCCSEHQRENWKDHKADCFPYEVSSSQQLGRFLVANRDLRPGDAILVDTPLVFGPKPYKTDEGPFSCVGCSKILPVITHLCPQCGWPACGAECDGLTSPQIHGLECQILKLRPRRPDESEHQYFRFDILIVLRALFLQKTNKKKWEMLLNLEDHLDDRGPESRVFKAVREKVSYIHDNYIVPLKEYESQSGGSILPHVSTDIMHKIYATLDVNATEITDLFDAFVLYPTASLLEHDCTPNTCQNINEKDGFKITFRAALPIMKGEHITTTYTNILWGTQERRKHLKETKYFTCSCKRCADPTEFETYFSALICLGTEDDPCKGIQLPTNPLDANTFWICNKCGIKLPNKEIGDFVEHLSKEVSKETEKKPNMEELEEFLGKLEVFLHPNHHLVYSIKHILVQSYRIEDEIEISNKFLDEKLKLCQELIDTTRKIDPGNARLALYLAVLLNEQFLARFKLLSRSFNSEDKNSCSAEIEEVLTTVADAKESLKYERQSETGGKLLQAVEANEMRFKKWLEGNLSAPTELIE
ncbi:SET domain-containing protein SmydA-8-like [Euwallacea similis]|uniref:SET domain-containing protein SmydA-8-like n=1 Tax=Euwallacea similis TaxID=1736056 RepID=UPI00344FC011